MTNKPSPDSADPVPPELEPEVAGIPAPVLAADLPDASHLELFLPPASEATQAAPPVDAPAAAAQSGLRSARLLNVANRSAVVQVRGEDEPREVGLDPDVDAEVVRDALENGDRVMIEPDELGELVLVGVLRCRQPDKIKLSASVIEIDADRELVLRSGKGAVRIREDGDIEIVGSRISAASRGLFRLVGKMLRLN